MASGERGDLKQGQFVLGFTCGCVQGQGMVINDSLCCHWITLIVHVAG